MTLIESEKLHEYLGDYYDSAYSKNKVNAMKNLSKPIREIKGFIEVLEELETDAEIPLKNNRNLQSYKL